MTNLPIAKNCVTRTACYDANDHKQIASLKQRLAAMANAIHDEKQDMSPKQAMRLMEEIVANNEIVFGLWQNDPARLDGVGMTVIKGIDKLPDAITLNVTIDINHEIDWRERAKLGIANVRDAKVDDVIARAKINTTIDIKILAIPCTSYEQALALRQTHGDRASA